MLNSHKAYNEAVWHCIITAALNDDGLITKFENKNIPQMGDPVVKKIFLISFPFNDLSAVLTLF